MLDVFLWLAILWCVGAILDEIEKKPSAAKAAWKIIAAVFVGTSVATGLIVSRIDSAAIDGHRAGKEAAEANAKYLSAQLADIKATVGTDSPSEIKKRMEDMESRIAKLSPHRLDSKTIQTRIFQSDELTEKLVGECLRLGQLGADDSLSAKLQNEVVVRAHLVK